MTCFGGIVQLHLMAIISILWYLNSSLLSMAIEIVDLPLKMVLSVIFHIFFSVFWYMFTRGDVARSLLSGPGQHVGLLSRGTHR